MNSASTKPQAKSNEWYTPAKYIEAARRVMGGIDLDPASCELANQTVRADKFYSEDNSGLIHSWYGCVFLNPPYANKNHEVNEKKSTIADWVGKLIHHYQAGDITQAIALTTMQTQRKWFRLLWEYPICFADHCVRFDLPYGTTRPSRLGRYTDSHIFGTIFVYLGPNEQAFITEFSQFGTIAKRVSAPREKPLELWGSQ